MKKVFTTIMILEIFLIGNVMAIDETMIKDEEGLYVETVASVGIPNLNAKSAILYDATYDRILFEKNSKQRRANASTTKMITALVAVENGNLEDIVEVSKNAASTGGSGINLKAGDKITLEDLIKGLLVHSGNDAAVAIAEYISESVENFSYLMNEKAEEIGALDSHFVTPHGLDEENHYSTAYDLMLIAKKVLENEILSSIISKTSVDIVVNGQTRTLNSTNEMLTLYSGANGVKTGYTGNAGRCLITSVKRDDRLVISVVLGCDSKKNRTVDSLRLLDYAFQEFYIINLGDYVKEELFIVIDKSESGIYRLKKEVDINYLIKESEKEHITIEYVTKNNLVAPLEKGEIVGCAKVKLNGNIIAQISYKLPESVKRNTWKNFFEKIINKSMDNITNFKLSTIIMK